MSEETQNFSASFSHSATIGAIAGALAKAQGKFKKVVKDSKNPFFKSMYADLATMIEATKDALSANEIVLVQSPGEIIGNQVKITSILAHSSGEWMRGEIFMPTAKLDAQGIGSATTYARRYAYQSLLNIAGESDDDGSAAVGQGFKPESNEEFDQRTENQRPLMNAQVVALNEAMKRSGKPAPMVEKYLLDNHKVNQFEKLLRADFQSVLKWLNSFVKRARDAPSGDSKAVSSPDQTDKAVRDTVNKKVWALAAEKSVPMDDVKKYSYERFGVDSMTKLDAGMLREVVEWLNTLA